MRAMILAAGRGERMGGLTHQTPKPLLKVAGNYLIEYAILSLKRAGIVDIVINVSYHRDLIKQALGDGQAYGINIQYSEEVERLETGGGIYQALPLLGNEPFIVVSSDIITDFPMINLQQKPLQGLVHLVMVTNPSYHPEGDFGLTNDQIDLMAKPKLTFANVGLYDPQLFNGCEPGYFRLASLLLPAIHAQKVSGEWYRGLWYNVGTPADLDDINRRAREDAGLRPLMVI